MLTGRLLMEVVMDRVERRRLKHDELVDGTANILHRFEQNPKPWIYGAGAIVAAVAVLLIANSVISAQHRKSADLLARGQAAMFSQVSTASAAKPNDPYAPSFNTEAERVATATQRLSDAKSAWGSAGKLARYLLGVTKLEAGDAAGAVSELEVAARDLAGDATLAAPARIALAQAYAAAGQNDKALSLFTELAADTTQWYPRDVALAGKARAQQALGQASDAKGTWQQLIDLFPASPLLDEAKRTVEKL
jgi:tetratricopeptide (TPR) repeat protein